MTSISTTAKPNKSAPAVDTTTLAPTDNQQLDFDSPEGAGPTATERRLALVRGVEDFDKAFPQPSATEAVDDFLSKSRLSSSGPDRFDWTDDDLVVVQEQRTTAVYWNQRGQLVIRQDAGGIDDDPFVAFDPERVPSLIARLKAEHESFEAEDAASRT